MAAALVVGQGGERFGDQPRVDRLAARAEVDQAAGHLLELAHVARPALPPQLLERLDGHPAHPAAGLAAHLLEETAEQERQVVLPLAQRRHLEHVAGEPVEEVLAEVPLGDRRAEVDVGGGEDPHVDLDRLLAERHHLALLQHPQQLGLEGQRQVADLVEEEGAAVGLEEAAAAALDPGRHPGADAEQLGLEQLGRDRRAVDRHEGPARPLGAVVQGARHVLLAGAGLAEDEDRHHPGRHQRHLAVELAHRRRGPGDDARRQLERRRWGSGPASAAASPRSPKRRQVARRVGETRVPARPPAQIARQLPAISRR